MSELSAPAAMPGGAAPLPAGAAIEKRALISRTADFWLLGGLSIVVWWVMRVLDPFRAPAAPEPLGTFTRTYWAHLSGAAATASLLVLYPHFLVSYRIAYSPGWRYVREHWFALIAVPAALLMALVTGWVAWGTGMGSPGLLAPVAAAFAALGIDGPFRADLTTGAATMALLVHVLLFATGWHYGKQAYGACLIYARYDGYALDDLQRRVLRWAIHGIWISKWVHRLAPSQAYDHHGIQFLGLGLPQALVVGSAVAAGALVLGVVWLVVLANHRRTGELPSLNAAVPFVAFLVWWFPPLANEDFTGLLVPVFHAVQYMAFVARVETADAAKDARSAQVRLTLLAFVLVAGGALAFELLPGWLDRATGAQARTHAFFFVASASLFLNLHHYCIDAAIWRMRDPRVREVLF